MSSKIIEPKKLMQDAEEKKSLKYVGESRKSIGLVESDK